MGLTAVTVAVLNGCSPSPRRPAERSISFGFESIATERPRWQTFQNQLARVNANAINLCVGRVDWTAFNWGAHPEAVSAIVERTGRDYVAEAIKAWAHPPDARREVTLTIDALMPALIAEHPHMAGTDTDGQRSESFASLTALTEGTAGDRLIRLTTDICRRYRPHRVALTELMFDDHTFGGDDLASYLHHSGARDWPRHPNGTIDTGHDSIARWRSEALASLVARAAETAHAEGARLDMDVRAPWDDPAGDRALSGHDYALMLDVADRIIVWNYYGLSHRPPEYSADIAGSLNTRASGRFVLSTGMWAHDGTISPNQLASGLKTVGDISAAAVSPASMLTDAHWKTIANAWSA